MVSLRYVLIAYGNDNIFKNFKISTLDYTMYLITYQIPLIPYIYIYLN